MQNGLSALKQIDHLFGVSRWSIYYMKYLSYFLTLSVQSTLHDLPAKDQ